MKKVFPILALLAVAACAIFAAEASASSGPIRPTSPPAQNSSSALSGSADHVFLCYSQWQIDPGAWAASEASLLTSWGYWQPVAEKAIRTQTYIGNGYYLFCNGIKTGYPILGLTGNTIGGSDGANLGTAYPPDGGNYPEAVLLLSL